MRQNVWLSFAVVLFLSVSFVYVIRKTQYLKFLKEGVSVNGVTYPDTVLLWGKQLYEILAEKWNL